MGSFSSTIVWTALGICLCRFIGKTYYLLQDIKSRSKRYERYGFPGFKMDDLFKVRDKFVSMPRKEFFDYLLEENGRTSCFHLEAKTIVVTFNRSMIRKILTDEEVFTSRPSTDLNELYFNYSMWSKSGQDWKDWRRNLSFISTDEKVKCPQISEKIKNCVRRVTNKLNSKKKKKFTLDIRDMCECYAIDISMTILFGHQPNIHNSEVLKEMYLKVFSETDILQMATANFNLPFSKEYRTLAVKIMFLRNMTFFLLSCGYELSEIMHFWMEGFSPSCRQTVMDDSLMAAIMDQLDLSDLSDFSVESFIGNMSLILWIAVRMVSTMTTCAFYLLSKNSDIQDKLRKNIQKKGPSHPYVEKVALETLRLYPLATLVRQAVKETQLEDFRIEEGTVIMISPWHLHSSEDLWDDPKEFYPERFNDIDLSQDEEIIFIPFGHGARACPGKSLALNAFSHLVAGILQDYRVVDIPDKTPESLTFTNTLLEFVRLSPEKEIKIRFEKLNKDKSSKKK